MERKVKMPSEDTNVLESEKQPIENLLGGTVAPEEELPTMEVGIDDDLFEEDEAEEISIFDMDPETILWENGPTAGQLVAWKNQYKKIIITSIDVDEHVVWRRLTRPEYRNIVRQIEQLISSNKFTQAEANLFNEEILCQVCCLHPTFSTADFDNVPAGLPAILSQQILETSGFNAIEVREI